MKTILVEKNNKRESSNHWDIISISTEAVSHEKLKTNSGTKCTKQLGGDSKSNI